MTFKDATVKTPSQVLAEFNTSVGGLPASAVAARQQQYGFNELKGREVKWWNILLRQFNSPFIYLLLAAGLLAAVLGELVDALIILVFILINAVLGFLEEWHSEQSLKLLKQYVITTVRVRRGGGEMHIPTRELVPGDVVVFEAGDIIAADVRFLECSDVAVNESVLTGESAPVTKIPASLPQAASAVHEASNLGFTGTSIVSGQGVGVVFATGTNTVLGEISRLTVETRHQSGFEKGIKKFSTFILRMIIVILVLLFVASLLIKQGETSIFELLLFSIALAVSVVPEALPVVTTIALSKGAARLAKHKVVVKRLSAVEDLGSVEVLCSDKTGTLTENKLTVEAIEAADPTETLRLAAAAAAQWSGHRRDANNAFDLALWEKLGVGRAALKQWKKIAEIPFDPERKRNSVLLQTETGTWLVVRGAAEAVFDLCPDLSADGRRRLGAWVATQGVQGRRVIALGKRSFAAAAYTVGDEAALTFVGLIAFADPIKHTARYAIEAANHLGVQLKILTGDSPEVAGAVAVQVGLIRDPRAVITGAEFFALSPAAQAEVAERYQVFARVAPEQKFGIIELLQKRHEVGFLGEGINDAPALKIADVGIVVAEASDIAREAADIVLLKQSLATIIDGIREGREIFANTVKYIKATLISNFGNFYAIAVASLIVTFLPMLPVQLLLLNLLSDFPMIAIATDTVDKTELRRPRSYQVREVVLVAMILGLVSMVFDFIFFGLFFRRGAEVLQSNWFIGSVITELLLIFSIRTRGFFLKAKFPGRTLTILSAVAFGGALLLPLSSLGQRVFHFVAPSRADFLLILAVAAIYFVITEAVKLLYYRHTHEAPVNSH